MTELFMKLDVFQCSKCMYYALCFTSLPFCYNILFLEQVLHTMEHKQTKNNNYEIKNLYAAGVIHVCVCMWALYAKICVYDSFERTLIENRTIKK